MEQSVYKLNSVISVCWDYFVLVQLKHGDFLLVWDIVALTICLLSMTIH